MIKTYKNINTVGVAVLYNESGEKMLKRRYAQDPDSGDMLDIIYSTKLFDLGFVANWNNIQGVANSAISAGKIPKAAAYTRAAKAIPNLIQQDYEQFLLMGKE